MKKLLVITEEKSAYQFLEKYISRYVKFKRPNWRHGKDYLVKFIFFKGKGELLKKLGKSPAIPGITGIIVLMDQDNEDCRQAKCKLRNAFGKRNCVVKFRIACHELEAFYLGDLETLRRFINKNISTGGKSPDSITNPSSYIGGYCHYSKTELANQMGGNISHDTRSVSFQMLQRAIAEILSL